MTSKSVDSYYPIEFPHSEDIEKIAQILEANQQSGLTGHDARKRIKE